MVTISDHKRLTIVRPGPALLLLAISVAVSAIAIVALTVAAPRATAQNFQVNTTDDSVDSAIGDGVCAAAGGQCSLRAAVQEANALGGPDGITLPAGTYMLTGAADEDGAASGDLDITGGLTIEGAGSDKTFIDAGESDRAFQVAAGETVSISRLTIRNGRSIPNDGGAINNGGTLTLRSMRIENSHGDDGGALANHGSATVLDSVFSNNDALDSGGAVISSGTLTMTRTAIELNEAPYGAGGVNNLGTLTMNESLLAENRAQSGNGGGLSSFGLATLTNVTVSGNDATLTGGGIYSENSLLLISSTIADNDGSMGGGGLYTHNSGAQFRSTIIAGNRPDQCAGPGGYASHGTNLSDSADCLFAAGGDMQNTDPMLAALADNGGLSRTHALVEGSPAIDGGQLVGCPPTDQRGVTRPQNGQCDIGAFEAGSPATPTPAATDTPPATSTPIVEDTPTPPDDTPTPTTQPPTATRTPTPVANETAGDSNCDGNINSIDAALVLQNVAGLLSSLPCALGADANEDGTLNSIDAALILQYGAGLLNRLPP